MEDLFWTTLTVNGVKEDYHIIFENEMYCFLPKDESFDKICYRREHDEWHATDEKSERLKNEAVDALEQYLLRQH